MRAKLSLLITLAAVIGLMPMAACGGSSSPSEGSGASNGGGAAAPAGSQADTGAKAEAEAAAMAAGNVPAGQMAEHIGEEITAQGRVSDYIRVTGSGHGKPTLFLFDVTAAMTAGSKVSDLKTPGGAAVLIWREDSKNFPENFREFYKGKTICVTGTVETFQENTVIIAKDQSQIDENC